MSKNCYICNKTVREWHQDLTELKLIYAKFSISIFLKKFLMDFQSKRNVDDKLNCICEKCFTKIKVYDWFLMSANEKKDELRSLFMKTEKLFGVKFKNDEGSEINAETEVNGNNDESRDDISNHSEEDVELISIVDDDEEEESFEIFDVVDISESETDRLPVEVIKEEIDSEQENGPEAQLEVELSIKKEFENDDDAMETDYYISGTDANHDNVESFGSKEASNQLESFNRSVSNEQNLIVDESEIQKNEIMKAKPTFTVEEILILAERKNENKVRIIVNPKPQFESLPRLRQPFGIYLKCDICNDGTVYSEGELMKHKKRHERKCKICGLEFNTARKLRVHMKVHEKYEELVCLTCLYKCDNKDAYKEHIALHVNKPKSQCVLCDKVYKGTSHTREHVQIVHMNVMVLCEICGKSFSNNHTLSDHRRRHQSDRPEKCTYCPKTFKTKGSWKKHKKTHTQTERPFACTFCDMRFKLKFHWQQHERRHKENTKTLKCVLCESAFEHKFHLNQHMERKHGVQVPSGSGSQRKVEVIN